MKKGEVMLEIQKIKISNSRKGKGLGNQFAKGNRPNITSFKKGLVPWVKGKKFSDEHKRKLSEAHVQNPTRYWLGQKRLDMTGEKNWNWKGGINSVIARRARLANAEGFHTLQEWEDLKNKYNYMCLCCKQFEPEIKLTEDHIIPLTLAGSNYITNIQPLCGKCNLAKWTKFIDYREIIVSA